MLLPGTGMTKKTANFNAFGQFLTPAIEIGSKHIPAAAFDYNFLGIKNVTVTPVTLTKSETPVSAIL